MGTTFVERLALDREGSWGNRLWKRLKVWRRIPVGPVALRFKFERLVPIVRRDRHADSRHAGRAQAVGADHTGQQSALSTMPVHSRLQTVLLVGVGPGFGHALARRLAQEGFQVIVVSRNALHLAPLVAGIRGSGGKAFAYGADATDERAVGKLFAEVEHLHGLPDLVVYSVQAFMPGQAVDVDLPAFETCLKHNCVGSFLVARAAARAMLPRGSGTIVLVGSTSALIGRADHLNVAVGRFAQRGLSQVMARELWPKGIHVAHLVIDADIDETEGEHDPGLQSDPHHIAQVVLDLHRQPRSAWSSELDVRPANERFWEHC